MYSKCSTSLSSESTRLCHRLTDRPELNNEVTNHHATLFGRLLCCLGPGILRRHARRPQSVPGEGRPKAPAPDREALQRANERRELRSGRQNRIGRIAGGGRPATGCEVHIARDRLQEAGGAAGSESRERLQPNEGEF